MATKKSAVDRVIFELEAERAGIDATLTRLRNAQATAIAKKKPRKAKPQAVAAADGGR